MSVEKRKWSWKSHEKSWEWYRHRYYFIIFVLSFPGALLSMIKQHGPSGHSNLGCDPGYEKLGLWYEVFFIEVFPIVLGFCCNLYVFFHIRRKMSQSAFPQSVRKRRKRIMYHYIIVCILCWIPTIVFYFVELIGFHVPPLEIVARTSLYISGFLNFLVFGMQDPHLKRSFVLVLHWMGLSYIVPRAVYYRGPLKTSDVEKTVMFEEATISRNADLSKDKKNIYRYHKLSKDDKKALYAERPDLDPRGAALSAGPLSATALAAAAGGGSARKGTGGTARSSRETQQLDSTASNNSSQHSLSVLSDIVVLSAVDSPFAEEGRSGPPEQALLLEEGHLRSTSPPSLRDNSYHSATGNRRSDEDRPLLPRDSAELTVAGEERKSLGLGVIGGGGASSSSFLGSDSSRSPGGQLKEVASSEAEAVSTGKADSDESSDDESDEEDKELNAPVGPSLLLVGLISGAGSFS